MKKTVCMLLVLVLLFADIAACAEEWVCPSCGNDASGNYCSNCGAKYTDMPAVDLFYRTALTSAQRLSRLCASSEIVSLYTEAEEAVSLIADFAGIDTDPDKLQRAAVFYLPCGNLSGILAVVSGFAGVDISEIYEYKRSTIPSILRNLIISREGVMWVVASSAASLSELMIADTQECFAFVLLDYGSDAPARVMTDIYVSGSGAALANTLFVPCGEITDMLFRIADGKAEDVGEYRDILGLLQIWSYAKNR